LSYKSSDNIEIEMFDNTCNFNQLRNELKNKNEIIGNLEQKIYNLNRSYE